MKHHPFHHHSEMPCGEPFADRIEGWLNNRGTNICLIAMVVICVVVWTALAIDWVR
ncbi:MAG: hypothetical protein AAB263_13405 [Planctomycetota bacterium]